MKKSLSIALFIAAFSFLSASNAKPVPKAKPQAEKPLLTATLLYDDGIVKYVGEVVNGKEHGKGISFDMYGKKVFEGQFRNGLPNGLGKMYDDEGRLSFEGEVANGVPTDNGVWFASDVTDINTESIHSKESVAIQK